MDSPTSASSRSRPFRADIERRAYERFMQRGGVHGADVEDWLEAERELLSEASAGGETTGISNRQSAVAEEVERQRFAPLENEPTESQQSEGLADIERISPVTDGQQMSNKMGSRSRAQKKTESRYPERSMPAAKKVGGAFGKEPRNVPPD
jgi:hypothetical protein